MCVCVCVRLCVFVFMVVCVVVCVCVYALHCMHVVGSLSSSICNAIMWAGGGGGV